MSLFCCSLDFPAPRFWKVRAGDLHELENGVPLIGSARAIDENLVEICENRSELCNIHRLRSRWHKGPGLVLGSCALQKL